MSELFGRAISIKFKQGLKASINTTATKNLAVTGEPHYCTDTKELYIYNGTINDYPLVSLWNDIQFNIESGRVSNANFPDWDSLTTNTGAYKFDVDDYIDLGAQEMLHGWKEESDVYFHVHTALDGANSSGSSYYAKFKVYVAYADEGGVYTETNKDIEIEIPDGTADLTHLFGVAEALDMTGLTIGTQMNVRLKRIAATTGDEYPNHIFVTQVGLHYEVDLLGSRQVGTK